MTSLQQACVIYGSTITGVTHKGVAVDGPLLLWAIAGCESDFGRLSMYARHEPGYMPGGTYFNDELRAAWNRYGILASCSYGPMQIMYITAKEMGFDGHPTKLQDDDVCVRYAARLVTERFIKNKRAATIADIFDAYNTGTHRDANRPTAYINKGVKFYEGRVGWTLKS